MKSIHILILSVLAQARHGHIESHIILESEELGRETKTDTYIKTS